MNILVLCTGNSARSILLEALLNDLGAGRVRAWSAGSRPVGAVNPGALRLLTREGFTTADLRSKSWDEFAEPGAPVMDLVITVCDSAAGEVCPIWPGHPLTTHWGVDDPARVTGPDEAVDAAFAETWAILRRRAEAMLALPLETQDPKTLKPELTAIGHLP